jgi:dihydrofolate reductase
MTMGRLSVVNFVSIDGVVQSPLSQDEDRDGGFDRGGWVAPFSDDVVERFMRDSTVGASGMLLGRRSYEILRTAWADADETEPAVAAMNRMPKYVVSSSSENLGWSNSHWVEGDLGSAVIKLKRDMDGGLVVFGSAALVRGLARLDLVDEYRLLLFPVLLGGGKRMFDDDAALARFSLVDTVVSPSGVAIHSFVRDTVT